MRALVVDDEPLARSELVYALGRIEGIVVGEIAVDEAAEAGEALRMLAGGTYDVVFLDVNLPGMNGVAAAEVVARLERPPRIVFVTAHDDRAVDAFVVGAVDYVVKPVSPARLARTIERLRARGAAAPPQPAAAGASRLALEDGERTRLVKVIDVRYVQANGHVVTARVFDGDLRWRGSLGDAAARLEPAGFLRVHRAYLVNPERVIEVEPFFGGSYLLRVDDKARSEVPVSRNYLATVKKALGL